MSVVSTPSVSDTEHEAAVDTAAGADGKYIVDVDAGVITCVCGYDHDDGFTIQCDHCNRWQHAICYKINDIDSVPEDYLCNVCQPRQVDAKRAKRLQMGRLKVKKSSTSVQDSDQKGSAYKKGTESPSGPKRVKANFLSAKDSYQAMYLPLSENDYKNEEIFHYLKDLEKQLLVSKTKETPLSHVPLDIRSYSDPSNARVFAGYTKLGVYITQNCTQGECIEEVLGSLDFMKNYFVDKKNHYRIWGTVKPKIFQHPSYPIYIDSRLSGNLTRYIRRSCTPNVVLHTILHESRLKFVLQSTRDIDNGEELQLPWNWDKSHPIWKIIKHPDEFEATIEAMNDAEKYLLIHSVDTILRSCDCACGNSNKNCHLYKIKKYSQLIYNKSIKGKMNNRYKINEILNQYQGKRRRQPPILSRLQAEFRSSKERASNVLLVFNSQKLNYLENHRNSYDDTILRPFKFRLAAKSQMSKKLYSEDKSIKIITNPAEYDETGIDDLDFLPVPIKLEFSKPSQREETASDKAPEAPSTINKAMSTPSLSGIKAVDRYKDLTSTSSLSDFHKDERPKILKKKLSFADYRKKLNK